MDDEAETRRRRQRLDELLHRRRYAEAVAESAEELSRLLGVDVTTDDAVSPETTNAALMAHEAQARYHLTSHRIWGVELREEMLATSRRLAGSLASETAVLVWRRDPARGFRVSIADALVRLPALLGPPPPRFGPGGLRSDVLLVGDDGQSGLLLEYNHHPGADEFELRSWGRFKVVLD